MTESVRRDSGNGRAARLGILGAPGAALGELEILVVDVGSDPYPVVVVRTGQMQEPATERDDAGTAGNRGHLVRVGMAIFGSTKLIHSKFRGSTG